MRYFTFLILFTFSVNFSSPAQYLDFNLKGIVDGTVLIFPSPSTDDNYFTGQKGDSIQLIALPLSENSNKLMVRYNQGTFFIKQNDLKGIVFETNSLEKFWKEKFLNSSINDFLRRGWQYELRESLRFNSLDFINNMELYGGFYKDAYVDNYLNNLLRRIYPENIFKSLEGNMNIRIVPQNTPNAFALPTGTILINSGLISTVDNEDELMGVLAHEVAHVILDHHINNINEELKRERRAAFWSAVATAAAAGAEAYAASQGYNTGGMITASVFIASTVISSEIIKEMGARYSRNQEFEADLVADELMRIFFEKEGALYSALNSMLKYNVAQGDFESAYSGSDSHPALNQRVQSLSKGDIELDEFYIRKISSINTLNAYLEKEKYNFEQALILVNKNIDAGIGVEADYLLRAEVTMYLDTSNEAAIQALKDIEIAESLAINPYNIANKLKGLAHLRLKERQLASDAFNAYAIGIEKMLKNKYSDNLKSELVWAKNMKYKANKL